MTAARALQPVQVRRGLPRVARRLASGQVPQVAWFGGSVTWGGGAEEGDLGYRGRTVDALRAAWGVPLRSTNAAIGGTGSDLGAFRLRQDVLSVRPDLVVVEFGVNDAPGPRIAPAYEGVVRASLESGADVLVIHALQSSYVDSLASGALPEVQVVHEAVAMHYGVPSVHLGLALAHDIAARQVAWEEFAADGVHPTPDGHARYADVLLAAVPALLAGAKEPADLPVPLHEDPWDDGRLEPLPDAPGWVREPRTARGGWECFAEVLVADGPGACLGFDVHGPVLGLYQTVDSRTGDLEVEVDGAVPKRIRCFDDYALQFSRPHYRFVATDLGPGRHRVRLHIAADSDPRSLGHRVELAALLVRGDQPATDEGR